MTRPLKRPFLADNSGDVTDEIGNNGGYIDFWHVPTGENVRFKAFITSLDEQYNPMWEEMEAYGRMDAIGQYKRTSRTISITFEVPSTDLQEAKNNQERYARFVSMLYPTYSTLDGGAQTINASPLIKVKFMNLVQDVSAEIGVDSFDAGLLGYINGSVSRAINNDEGYFRAGLYEMYPKYFSVSFSFTVLHQHEMGWNEGSRRGSFRKFPYGKDLDAEIENAEAASSEGDTDGGNQNSTDADGRETYNEQSELLEDQ